MAKKLLIFIQSDNPALYVNILMHCVQREGVQDVYFAVNEGDVGKFSDNKDKIRKIRSKFEELLVSHSEYQIAYNVMPLLSQIEAKIIKVLFTNPASSIKELKRRFSNTENLIVDISGCSKKVSSDVISSYISNGINHICCFELDDRVHSRDWGAGQHSKNSRMYHNVCKGVAYYEYIDFSRSGATIESFNRMRAQGKLIRLLFVVSIFLGVLVVALIQQQQNVLAQYAAVILALATGLGLFNDIFGIVDRLK